MILTLLTKKFRIAFPPTIKIEIMAVAECNTRLKLPLTIVQTDWAMDMIIPTFSRPKFINTVKFSRSNKARV